MIPDRLRVLPQHLIPQHAASAAMHRLMQIRIGWVKTLQIAVVRRLYGIDLSEAREPDPSAYPTFNAFFTRALREDARPLAPPPAVLAPADGTLSGAGHAREGTLLQAKRHAYGVAELLADEGAASPFAGAAYATIYLSPRDYHRVHMPAAGELRSMTYVPGRLFSVNAVTTRTVPGLFARNERLVCLFDTDHGPLAVVLVGAIFVGSMETIWAGQITPPYGGRLMRRDYSPGEVRLERGAELGRFNMGSTVILLCGGEPLAWAGSLGRGRRVRMGEALGTWPRAS